MTKNNRMVGYIRVSGQGQKDTAASIDAQMIEIRRTAATAGALLVDVYIDDGANGAPEFEQRDLMIAEIVDLNVDAVVVANLSRLSRDPMRLHNIRRSLEAWRIEVIAADKETMMNTLRFFNPDR